MKLLRPQFLGSASIITFFALLFMTAAAAGVALSCSTQSTMLQLSNTTISASCINVSLSNVSAQGNMFLNVSIAALIASAITSSPSSSVVNLTITNFSAANSAILLVEGYPFGTNFTSLFPSPAPTLSIVIQSFSGQNGCLVFRGSFPPNATIIVADAVMSSNIAASQTLLWLGDANSTAVPKTAVLASLSLTGSSSVMMFARCSFVVANGALIGYPFYVVGNLSLTGGSTLAFTNVSANSTSSVAWYFFSSFILLSQKSSLLFTGCIVVSAGSNALSLAGSSSLTMSGNSVWSISQGIFSTLSGSFDTIYFVGVPISLSGQSTW